MMKTVEQFKQFRHEASKLVAARVHFDRVKMTAHPRCVHRVRRKLDDQLAKVQALANDL
jgi:hypothetical protein